MQIRIEQRHGRSVFVSVPAERGRKEACLCVREENGKAVMCAHLRANMALEKALKNMLERLAREMPTPSYEVEFKRLLRIEAHRAFEQFVISGYPQINSETGVCRRALAEYAMCVIGGGASAITQCPQYKPEEGRHFYRYSYTPWSNIKRSMPRREMFIEAEDERAAIKEIEELERWWQKNRQCEENLLTNRTLEGGEFIGTEFRVVEEFPTVFAKVVKGDFNDGK